MGSLEPQFYRESAIWLRPTFPHLFLLASRGHRSLWWVRVCRCPSYATLAPVGAELPLPAFISYAPASTASLSGAASNIHQSFGPALSSYPQSFGRQGHCRFVQSTPVCLLAE